MTTTAAPLRKSDVSRMVGRILGKQHRSAANGWDVITFDAPAVITLNHFSDDDDRAALNKITSALGDRYTFEYVPVCSDYSALPDDYHGCAMVYITRKPAPAHEEPTVPATPTVSVTLPADFCAWFDGTNLVEGQDDNDPDCKALRLAYEAATLRKTAHGHSAKITTSSPTVLKMITEYAETLADSNADEADRDPAAARELDAAQTTAQRARTALTKLRTALTAHKAQQGPQEPATAPQDDDTPAPRDITVPVGAAVTATVRGQEYTGIVETAGPLRAATTAHARQGIRTQRIGIRVPGRPALVWADSHEVTTPADTPEGPAPVTARVDWTKTVRGHHNGVVSFPNGTTYKITHIEHATPARGALADHIAHDPTADVGPARRIARAWGLDALAADCARHAGYTGPVTIEQTGRQRLTLR
jgi:hypothetical protein